MKEDSIHPRLPAQGGRFVGGGGTELLQRSMATGEPPAMGHHCALHLPGQPLPTLQHTCDHVHVCACADVYVQAQV